jgi:ribosomal protein S18 acetylase RimI-like enzyme
MLEGMEKKQAPRRATTSDVDAIGRLVERAYGGYECRLGIRPGPMDDDYARRVSEDEVWVVAPQTGGLAGLLVLAVRSDHLLLDNIAVDPERQGEGLGRRLLDLAERRAREQGFDTIRLYTHHLMVQNQRIYERDGYVETHREPEHGFGRVFYTKHLG